MDPLLSLPVLVFSNKQPPGHHVGCSGLYGLWVYVAVLDGSFHVVQTSLDHTVTPLQLVLSDDGDGGRDVGAFILPGDFDPGTFLVRSLQGLQMPAVYDPAA